VGNPVFGVIHKIHTNGISTATKQAGNKPVGVVIIGRQVSGG
jgi:hypothetical protein